MSASPRLLALRLACLSARDRQWLLSQLGPTQAARVQALIDDAGRAGLLRDPSALSAVLAALPATEATPLPHLEAPAWRLLALMATAPEQLPREAAPAALRQQVERTLAAHPLPAGWRRILAPALEG